MAVKLILYSSTKGSAFARRLREEFASSGYEVRIVAAVRSSTFRKMKGGIAGAAVRVWMNLSILAKTFFCLARYRDAIHIVTTNPFFLPACAGLFRSRRTVQLLYDLYPDVLVKSGIIRGGGWAEALIARATRYGLRRCSGTIFLGERLQEFAESKYGNTSCSAVIAVGADGSLFPSFCKRDEDSRMKEEVRFLYCGNMGRMHDIETLGEALVQILGEGSGISCGMRFIFHASGSGYSKFRTMLEKGDCAGDVDLEGPIESDDEWAEVLRGAAVSFVTLADGAEDLVMPSKVYSSLVAGNAIIAVCNPDSDLARLVTQLKCGWVINLRDVEGLKRAINDCSDNRNALNAMRARAFSAGHERFDVARLIPDWNKFFKRIIEQRDLGASRVGRF